MLLSISRVLAALFAVGLAIGEAAINWGEWQWWPLWVVDYVCVVWLLAGVYATRGGRPSAWLTSAWAFTAGVFYLALFAWLEPIRADAAALARELPLLRTIAAMLAVAVVGCGLAALAARTTPVLAPERRR
jgi:hypothetical protein